MSSALDLAALTRAARAELRGWPGLRKHLTADDLAQEVALAALRQGDSLAQSSHCRQAVRSMAKTLLRRLESHKRRAWLRQARQDARSWVDSIPAPAQESDGPLGDPVAILPLEELRRHARAANHGGMTTERIAAVIARGAHALELEANGCSRAVIAADLGLTPAGASALLRRMHRRLEGARIADRRAGKSPCPSRQVGIRPEKA